MQTLVLFEPRPEPKVRVVERPATETFPADHVSTEPFWTASRAVRGIRPLQVRLQTARKTVIIELVGPAERLQTEGQAGVGVKAGTWFLAVDALEAFRGLPGKSALFVEKDGKPCLNGTVLQTIEAPPDWKELRCPRNQRDATKLLPALREAREYLGEASRYDFDKILLDPDGKDLRIVATNSKVFYQATLKDALEGVEEVPILLPDTKAFMHPGFIRSEKVFWAHNGSSATFYGDGITWQIALMKGRFPDYRKVLPDTNTWPRCNLNAGTLPPIQEALKSVKREAHVVLTFQAKKDVRLTIEDKTLEISATGYTGKEMKIGFQAEYLRQVLTLTGLNAVAVPQNEKQPLQIIGETAWAFLMPCTVV
jgi:hypothetical protein